MKKIDYAKLYTKRADGRYMGYWHDSKGIRHKVFLEQLKGGRT